jgi:GTPase
MKKIKLALVGRPNVGKSSLFNRICKKRISIVDEKPGVTRDRIYGKADFFGKPFDLIDTGGMDPKSDAPLNEKIIVQAELAIKEADVLVMVVDGRLGPVPLDFEVAKVLRKTSKPLVLAVNKVDHPSLEGQLSSFCSLGIPRMVSVSATQGHSIAELLETAFHGYIWEEEEEKEETGLRIAIVGRPNVGKSTLLNYVLKEERSMVSNEPGTTRDALDAKVTANGKTYTFVDTAGIRRKKSEKDVIDKFAFVRTQEAIEEADIALLVLDARYGMTVEEKKIAASMEEQRKGCILIMNKWDLVKGHRMEHAINAIRYEVPFLEHCPVVLLSAITGRNVEKIFDEIERVNTERSRRITTGELNKFVEGCLQKYHPPQIGGKRLRIYYMTQIEIAPPKFVIFVNYPELMTDTYRKYLINQFRERYGFSGCPLVFDLKGKEKKKGKHEQE